MDIERELAEKQKKESGINAAFRHHGEQRRTQRSDQLNPLTP